MTTVVVAPTNVADFPEGGGHFWVYMQYIQGLRSLGCDVYWLEHLHGSGDAERDRKAFETFISRMNRFDLADKLLIVRDGEQFPLVVDRNARLSNRKLAESICGKADLLLNFTYAIDRELLSRFRTTALIDIDPGLLQFWMSQGQLDVPSHDIYFTTGETVGRDDARFSDCGIDWNYMAPIVHLGDWPPAYDARAKALTTVSGWWAHEWISDGGDVLYDNTKRASFLEFVQLAAQTDQTLELALAFAIKKLGNEADACNSADSRVDSSYGASSSPLPISEYDAADRATLESHGWKVRHSIEVAGNPESYQRYVQESRGEFSCAKPSCMRFQNAWVSDRSLCYLASGKPVIVQNTGPSRFLPDAEGMFRFSTPEEALSAIDTMNSDYASHCEAARSLAETYFDSTKGMESVLNRALALPSATNF